MKKAVLFLSVFFMFFITLYAQDFAVDSTRTMNNETFQSLRNATDPNIYKDEVMRFYWCKLIGIDPPPDGENGEGDFRGERADYEPINKFFIFYL